MLQVAGLTEAEVRGKIQHQLEIYMHSPQFNLFVREYRSRQVAVIGAVAKPGLYNLASETDTILDIVASAGGMTVEAASRILLIPAEPTHNGRAKALAAVLPVQLASAPPSSRMLKQTEPLVLDLQNLARGGDQIYLSLPARPGDVIIVPASGQVLGQGWVEKPGPYKITPGLTVLGAVAAAGGPLFPANTSSVRILRSGKRGDRLTYTVDLEQIKQGEMPDFRCRKQTSLKYPPPRRSSCRTASIALSIHCYILAQLCIILGTIQHVRADTFCPSPPYA